MLRLSRCCVACDSSPRASGGPDPWRYATSGRLAEDLRSADFQDVHEEVLRLTWAFAGTPEQFWAFQSDLGGAWSRPGWDALSTDEQAVAEAEVFSLLEAYRVGQRLDIPRRTESRDGYPIGRPPLSVRRKVDNIAVWAGFRSCS